MTSVPAGMVTPAISTSSMAQRMAPNTTGEHQQLAVAEAVAVVLGGDQLGDEETAAFFASVAGGRGRDC